MNRGVAMMEHDTLSCPQVSSPSSACTAALCSLQVEDFRTTVAQRLVRMLLICAGHVPGVSALNLLSLLRTSETPPLEEL